MLTKTYCILRKTKQGSRTGGGELTQSPIMRRMRIDELAGALWHTGLEGGMLKRLPRSSIFVSLWVRPLTRWAHTARPSRLRLTMPTASLHCACELCLRMKTRKFKHNHILSSQRRKLGVVCHGDGLPSRLHLRSSKKVSKGGGGPSIRLNKKTTSLL